MTPPERLTLWVCDKGHVELGTLKGICWTCYPGGRRTWEPDRPEQVEANQTAYRYVLADNCPFCGHAWGRHDPEDGMCDAPDSKTWDLCGCGRDLPWMRRRAAELSQP
jgi:hypothetical protein